MQAVGLCFMLLVKSENTMACMQIPVKFKVIESLHRQTHFIRTAHSLRRETSRVDIEIDIDVDDNNQNHLINLQQYARSTARSFPPEPMPGKPWPPGSSTSYSYNRGTQMSRSDSHQSLLTGDDRSVSLMSQNLDPLPCFSVAQC